MIALGIDIGGSSVKAAALCDGRLLWTGKSAAYDRPRFDQLAAAVADASTDLTVSVDAIGLCIPGAWTKSANVFWLRPIFPPSRTSCSQSFSQIASASQIFAPWS